jgi:HK97 family phage portal protein
MGLTLLDLSEAKANIKASGDSQVGLTNLQPWFMSSLMGIKSASGEFVTYETALRASCVLACLRILSEDIATLPLNLYERTDTGTELALDNPLHTLVHDMPNEETTSVEMRENMILNLVATGNSYNQVIRTAGSVTEIWPLWAPGVITKRNDDGSMTFHYTPPLGGETVTLPGDQMWRTSILSAWGGITGRSMILLAREAIGLLLAAEKQAGRLYSNGAQIPGFLQGAPGVTYDKAQADALLASFNDAYRGAGNAFKTALLEDGLKYEKIGITAAESQFIESRKYQVTDVARIFRIPDIMLGISDGKSSTYASAEQFFLSYVKHTIMPWTVRIEQTMHRDLLLPSERKKFFFKHNLGALVRADLAVRYAGYSSAITAGWMCRNEARQLEDMNQVKGLDKFTMPLNTATVNEDGSIDNPNQPDPTDTGATPPDTTQDTNSVPGDNGQNARLVAMANAAAERVVRKEAKAKTFDAKFVAEVMSISQQKAEAYCQQRPTLNESDAVKTLVALAMEE